MPGRSQCAAARSPGTGFLYRSMLAATLHDAATRQLGYAWSRWRRRHRARARYHHNQARLWAALT